MIPGEDDRIKILSQLNKISQYVLENCSPEYIIKLTLESCIKNLNFDYISIAFLKNQYIFYEENVVSNERWSKHLVNLFTKSLISKIIKARKPFIIIVKGEEKNKYLTTKLHALGDMIIYIHPFLENKEKYGFMCICQKKFDEKIFIEFCQLFTTYVAQIIYKLYLEKVKLVNLYSFNNNVFYRLVTSVSLSYTNLFNDVHAFYNVTEHRMFAL